MWKEDGEEWVAGALETSGRSQVLVVGDQVGEPHWCEYKAGSYGSAGLRALQTQHPSLDRTLLLEQRDRLSSHPSWGMGAVGASLETSYPAATWAKHAHQPESERRGGLLWQGQTREPEASWPPTNKTKVMLRDPLKCLLPPPPYRHPNKAASKWNILSGEVSLEFYTEAKKWGRCSLGVPPGPSTLAWSTRLKAGAGHVTALCLSFPIYKIGEIILPHASR